MTRLAIALITLAALISVIAFDAATATPPNPYDALPPLALGSGVGSAGALCSAVGN